MQFPDTVAHDEPNRVAYVLDEVPVTYRELVDDSVRFANVLRAHGVGKGDVIAFLLPNMRGFFETAWAAQRSGLRYTAINTHLTAGEIGYILADCGAKALVTSTGLADLARDALVDAPGVSSTFVLDEAASPAPTDVAGFIDLRQEAAREPVTPTGPECEGADLLNSSGTTGRPKGVALAATYAPLGTPPGIVPFLQSTWKFDADSVYLSPAPLYHAAPLRFSLTVQRFGGTVIVMTSFDAEHALRLIDRHRVSHTQMVPTMFVRMLALPCTLR